MKLIDYYDSDTKDSLKKLLANSYGHIFPTIEEVEDYLKEQDDDEPSEKVMDDLVIQYLESEGIMFDVC